MGIFSDAKNGKNGNGNGDMPEPKGGLGGLLGRIARGQNKGEKEEQAAFWRTHKARESARQARVRAQKEKKGKK